MPSLAQQIRERNIAQTGCSLRLRGSMAASSPYETNGRLSR
jgi:hypothetical protein